MILWVKTLSLLMEEVNLTQPSMHPPLPIDGPRTNNGQPILPLLALLLIRMMEAAKPLVLLLVMLGRKRRRMIIIKLLLLLHICQLLLEHIFPWLPHILQQVDNDGTGENDDDNNGDTGAGNGFWSSSISMPDRYYGYAKSSSISSSSSHHSNSMVVLVVLMTIIIVCSRLSIWIFWIMRRRMILICC